MSKNLRLTKKQLQQIKQIVADITGEDIKAVKSRRDAYVANIMIHGVIFDEMKLANMEFGKLADYIVDQFFPSPVCR